MTTQLTQESHYRVEHPLSGRENNQTRKITAKMCPNAHGAAKKYGVRMYTEDVPFTHNSGVLRMWYGFDIKWATKYSGESVKYGRRKTREDALAEIDDSMAENIEVYHKDWQEYRQRIGIGSRLVNNGMKTRGKLSVGVSVD